MNGFWQYHFEQVGSAPIVWCNKADGLKRAADTLLETKILHEEIIKAQLETGVYSRGSIEYAVDIVKQPQIIPVYLYLIGMALEDILKAIYVAKFGRQIFDTKKRKYDRDKFAHHNLLKIAQKLNITLSANGKEAKLLKKLGEYIKWAGRYLTPLNAESKPPDLTFNLPYKELQDTNGNIIGISIDPQEGDPGVFNDLYYRLWQLVRVLLQS